MTDAEIMQLLAALGAVAVLLWFFQRWDERRMDAALKNKYPDHPTSPERLLTWDEKKASLEDDLKRAHSTTDAQDFMPFVGYLAAMSLGFRWMGWTGVLLGIPVGALLYYLIKAWIGRGRTKAARALADHLGKNRGDSFHS